jgi:hypothetical protein
VRIDFFLPFFTTTSGLFTGDGMGIWQEDERFLVRNQLDTKSGNQQKSVQLKPD